MGASQTVSTRLQINLKVFSSRTIDMNKEPAPVIIHKTPIQEIHMELSISV
ncbi:hypothetical protein CEXT_586971, partial [Caerostris extrusa]